MPHFNYQAVNAAGDPVTGRVEASNVQQAIADLHASGLEVHSIGVVSPTVDASGVPLPSSAHNEFDLTSHLQRVLGQAQAIVPALAAYAQELPFGRQRRELRRVCRVLERNDAAAATAALAELPEYWMPLLSAAASSNDPARVLNRFLDESHAALELHSQWRKSLTYPVVIAALSLGVLVALSAFVIPGFKDVFSDFDLRLPEVTILTLIVAGALTSGPVIVAVLLALALALLFALMPSLFPRTYGAKLADWWSGLWGGRPRVADFARFTADLLDAGLKLPEAVKIAGASTRRTRLESAAADLARDIETGHPYGPARYSAPLSSTVAFALGTQTSPESRSRLLKEISACHADRLRNRLSWSHGLLGPTAICIVGFLVGFVVLSLFLPLVDLINNLTG
jgi:type II secretory pathway component PulF